MNFNQVSACGHIIHHISNVKLHVVKYMMVFFKSPVLTFLWIAVAQNYNPFTFLRKTSELKVCLFSRFGFCGCPQLHGVLINMSCNLSFLPKPSTLLRLKGLLFAAFRNQLQSVLTDHLLFYFLSEDQIYIYWFPSRLWYF